MPYLVQPPAQSAEARDPLFTYALDDPIPSEICILKDLQERGWEVSVYFHDDTAYLNATKEIEKAIKTIRRRTQMIHGDMVGDSPRLTLEEMWQREMTKRSDQELQNIKEKQEVNDAASIMSRMTEQRAWVRWADDEAGLEAQSPNVVQATDKQSYLSHALRLEDNENSVIDIHEGPAGSPSTSIYTYNASRFIEERESDWHAILPRRSSQRAAHQPAGQAASSSSTSMSSTISPSSEAPVGLMGMSGYWCPPVIQARPQKKSQSQSITSSAVLPSRDSKETRKLKKKVSRRDSEPSVGKYLPLGFARPLSWVKGKRNVNEGASADATAPEQQQTQHANDAYNSVHTISRDNTPPPLHILSATARPESPFSPYQRTTPTQSAPNIHLQDHSPTSPQPPQRNPSPAFSTTSSLIFPGRDITPSAYFHRTNQPWKNLHPRQLTPPPGLEPEKDPYMWLAWDRGRKRQQDKTDRVLGKDSSLHRQDSGNGNASWYDGFQKTMKEEEAKVSKEEKKARKKEAKVRKREEKEERIRKEDREKEERVRKENEVREALRKKGDFAGGYLPRYV